MTGSDFVAETSAPTRRFCGVVVAFLCGFFGSHAHAIGTDAGITIENTAVVNFDIGGAAQTPVTDISQTLVDELIDVVVVDDSGGPVAVSSPESGAVLQFTVTNNGNGSEVFRLIADDTVIEGGFDPVLFQLYIESNGVPGLQVGGDTAYVSGTSDPTLAEDEVLTLYVASDIPTGLNQGDNGDIEVRAISETIRTQAGTDDPDDAAWPVPGVSYAGLGTGGGNAVVGASNDVTNLLIRTTGRYQVSDAVVSVTKAALTVVDPFGGTTLVPGTVITYELTVTVTGSGTADALIITDTIPAELEYQAGTLQIDGVGEDDDFAPAGTDNSGFNSGTTTVTVDRGTVTGGSPPIVVTFDAQIR